MRKFLDSIASIFKKLSEDNITVYSAYASFYMVISFVPFLMIILMIVGHFFPVTSADFTSFVSLNLPKSVMNLLSYTVDEILVTNSISLISIPAITLLWTASRSIVAVVKGLDVVYMVENRRKFLKLNIYGIFYTFTFFIAILFSLIIMVFGNIIADGLSEIFPFAIEIIDNVLSNRAIISLVTLTLFFTLVYWIMPGRHLHFLQQLPGAVFSASGWMIFSLVFSIYVDNFSNKSYLYGSLTALILLMLWIYFCMTIMFLGGEINCFLMREHEKFDK